MQKRLQEAMTNVEFDFGEAPNLPDRTLQRILSRLPSQRSKEQLAYLTRYVRRLELFRPLLQQKPHKYKEITEVLSPYWQLRHFRTGEPITNTGTLVKYVNILLYGKAYMFHPKNEQSFLNSVKHRNSKNRKKLSVGIIKKEELPPISQLLSIEEAAQLTKERGWVNDLLNPHQYAHTLEGSLKVGLDPIRWTCKSKYEECIAVCADPCTCLSVRWEVYSEIAAYREYLKKRTNIRLLLNFMKGLKYDEVIKYTNGSPTKTYEDKEQIRLNEGELYLVAEGQVVAAVPSEQEERDEQVELMINTTSRRPRPVCRSYQGELIGGQQIQEIRYFSHERSKIIRLHPDLLRKHMKEYPELAHQIYNMLQTRRQFLKSSILVCQNAAKQLVLKQKLEEVQVAERRNVSDLSVMEALKHHPKKGTSYKQHLQSCQITRAEGEVAVVVQHPNQLGKLVRCRRLNETQNEREIFMKLGFLNQEQITRHNSELLRRRASNGDLEGLKSLAAPLGGSRKSSLLEPPSFPSVRLFSKRCSLRLKCIS